jgi:hypothetical protein
MLASCYKINMYVLKQHMKNYQQHNLTHTEPFGHTWEYAETKFHDQS